MLFADLKGSMELLADRDPEEARKLLDPVLERMMEAVHRYEGTVNQVMGDGIMALFGAPVAHEDHAVRACYAAHDMQASDPPRRGGGAPGPRRRWPSASASTPGKWWSAPSGPTCAWTTLRSARQRTSRPAWSSSPSPIPRSLTADTLRLAEGFVAVKPLGPVPVKGLEAPVEVYEMVGAGPLRSRLQAAAARGLTRFVGRETEVEQLRQALGRAAAGHGQLVALVGEPGVGKSRLVWEVTHSHRTHGWLIVQASSVSYGKATPYLPVIDLLKGYLRIQDQDDPRAVREKVTGKLLTLDEALKPTCRHSWRCWTCRWTTPRGRRSTRRSAVSGPWRRSSVCSCARARSSRCSSSSRTSTGSTARPRRSWTVWSRACRRPGCSSS